VSRGRPRQQPAPGVELAAAAEELKAVREQQYVDERERQPRITQAAVGEALGLSEATVRAWESKTSGRGPSREQATLLDELFASKVPGYEAGHILEVWGWDPLGPDGGRSVEEGEFRKSEQSAVRTQAFNFNLDSEVGPGDSDGGAYLGRTVVANLRRGRDYEYVLAPPDDWLDHMIWWEYIKRQIVQFQNMCMEEAGPSVLGHVRFTVLATYADLNYSLDIHHLEGGETAAFVCEELPERSRLKGQRKLVKLSDPDKLRSVWSWLQTISREFGINYSPLTAHLEPLEPNIKENFRKRFNPNAGEWGLIRRLIQEEVRTYWTQEFIPKAAPA
jgi:hypothetical protein